MWYAHVYYKKCTNVQRKGCPRFKKNNDYSVYNHVILHSTKQLIARYDSLHHLLLILNICSILARTYMQIRDKDVNTYRIKKHFKV